MKLLALVPLKGRRFISAARGEVDTASPTTNE
jgi:hypothetical protein